MTDEHRPGVPIRFVVEDDRDLERFLESYPLAPGEHVVRVTDYASPAMIRSTLPLDPTAELVAVTPPTLQGRGAVVASYYKVRSTNGKEVVIDKETRVLRSKERPLLVVKTAFGEAAEAEKPKPKLKRIPPPDRD